MTFYELLPTLKGQYTLNQVGYKSDHVFIGELQFKSNKPRYDFAFALSVLFDPIDPEIRIGKDTYVHPTATIGGKGFGFENGNIWIGHRLPPIIDMPHFGGVIIDSNCYIGERVNIHRGVIDSTHICEWTKIDYGVHIAHNVLIGYRNTIAALCSIEGSVQIGNDNTFGSNVTVLRKVKIGSRCILGSGCVVTKDVPDDETWIGNPARRLEK